MLQNSVLFVEFLPPRHHHCCPLFDRTPPGWTQPRSSPSPGPASLPHTFVCKLVLPPDVFPPQSLAKCMRAFTKLPSAEDERQRQIAFPLLSSPGYANIHVLQMLKAMLVVVLVPGGLEQSLHERQREGRHGSMFMMPVRCLPSRRDPFNHGNLAYLFSGSPIPRSLQPGLSTVLLKLQQHRKHQLRKAQGRRKEERAA